MILLNYGLKGLNAEKKENIEKQRIVQIENRTRFELMFQQKFLDDVRFPLPYVTQQPCYLTNNITYFLDFYVPSLRLGIEIDGVAHQFFAQESDAFRDEKLRKFFGIKMVRVQNRDVRFNYHVVVEKLWPHIPHHIRNLYNKKIMQDFVL